MLQPQTAGIDLVVMNVKQLAYHVRLDGAFAAIAGRPVDAEPSPGRIHELSFVNVARGRLRLDLSASSTR